MASQYRFNYIDLGPKDGVPVLFLHGFMGCAEDWAECGVVTHLTEAFRVILVDLPGHGSTVVNGDSEHYRMEHCGAGLVEWLDTLNIERSCLVGYSMGGRLALYMALRYSERFERVILESASPGLASLEEREERIAHDETLARRLESEPLERFVDAWFEQPLFASLKRYPHRLKKLIRRRLESDPSGLALSLRMMGTGCQPSLWEELPRLTQRVLLIAGEEDHKFREIGRRMAAACPRARLETVEGTGHNVHFEKSGLYGELVRPFLENDS